jgi:alpha-tubulin suppressor-like RCC1 family protein
MPATNYTPIQLYRSTTSGALPSNANLSPGEVALNIADNDMSMYFENASGTVKRFFNNPAELKYPTADGTSGQFLTTNGGGVLSFGSVTAGALTNNTRQAVTSSATTTINLNSGNVIDLTMAANITTLSFTNVPASGTPILIQIVVKNASDGTAYTIVWPNSVYWSGQYAATTTATAQTAPTLATGANGVTVIALLTTDGGTKWRGWVEATIPGGTEVRLYAFGANGVGQLGLNNTTNTNSPVQIGSLANWYDIGNFSVPTLAINTAGQLFAWGNTLSGALGLNQTSTAVSSPTQVGSLTNWSQISVGYGSSAAIKTDGTLWTWGGGSHGRLGDGQAQNRSSPVQIGSGTDWSKVTTSLGNTFAIKTNGTLWGWGSNAYGALGTNNTGNVSSPVQIGALTTWSSVRTSRNNSLVGCANVFAIKTDGTLWAWGRNTSNNYGMVASNPGNNTSSPVQIGALTDWRTVSPGSYHCLAVKTDGTLWCWGRNVDGQLGLNNTYSSVSPLTSPKQIGALTDWWISSAGSSASAALRTNGTLWTWGTNGSGNLGLNDYASRSSPSQVGALTTWGPVTGSATPLQISTNCGFAAIATTISPA